MTYKPVPTTTQDGVKKALTTDARLLEMAGVININLGIIIQHLSLITKEDIGEDDLEDN